MTALAPAAPQQRGADPGMLGAELLVEVEQSGRLRGRGGGAAVRGLGRLLADLGERGVAARDEGLRLRGDLRSLADGGLVAVLRRLPALHHVQDDLLKIRLPAQQGLDLGLKVLQFPGRGHLAGLEPLAVSHDPAADLVDVALRLGLLAFEVTFLGIQRGGRITQLGVPLLELVQFLVLGQAPAAVFEPAELGVYFGELKQSLAAAPREMLSRGHVSLLSQCCRLELLKPPLPRAAPRGIGKSARLLVRCDRPGLHGDSPDQPAVHAWLRNRRPGGGQRSPAVVLGR